MNKLHRIILLIFAITLAVIPFTVIQAIAPPTAIHLYSVNAYQHTIESGDMLFIAYGAIDYTSYPTDYTANDSFLLRMFNGGTELAATQLFANPYFHYGYGKFMCSLYFNAADATAASLVWGSAYTVNLEANPAISWNGTAPSVATIAVTWSGTGQAIRIQYIMSQLQAQWGISLLDAGTLTDEGTNYGVSVIPNLRYIAPTIFPSYTVTPTYKERSKNWFVYASTLSNQWAGTWLDLTTLSTAMNIPKVWLYGGIWLIFMCGIIFAAIEAPQLISNSPVVMPTAKNTKMIFYLVIILVFFGGISGFLPWISLAIIGFILILMIVNQIFFNRATG